VVFAVEEALASRPELKFFDAAIEAKRRIKTAAGRERWLPDFSVEGSADQYFSESGAGQRGDYQDGLDDTDWQVGVFARLPLIEGGRKKCRIKSKPGRTGRLTDRPTGRCGSNKPGYPGFPEQNASVLSGNQPVT